VILKPRQVGESHLAAGDVEAAELGAAVELRENLARVEDLGWVERALHALLLVQIVLVEHHRHQVAVLDADAVLAGRRGVSGDVLYNLAYSSILDNQWEQAMRYVSATEAKQGLAAVLDAAQREPVVIRRQRRDIAVVLSIQEYERLTALNIAEFQRFCDRIGEQAEARGLTEEKLAEILASES
jgi:prevent-host-death family protein